MNERDVLLKRVQVCDFALNDVSLYLNTHPKDKMALAYFKKHSEMRKEATAAYEKKYGPLTRNNFDNNERWNWVDGPWPWEIEEA